MSEIRSLAQLQDIFQKSSGLVVLYIYATWCGHCSAFKSTWNDLTQHESKSLQFIQIDNASLTNDMREIIRHDIVGFPSIIVRNKEDLFFEYKGERTAESILAFINSHRSLSLGGGNPKTPMKSNVKNRKTAKVGIKKRRAPRPIRMPPKFR